MKKGEVGLAKCFSKSTETRDELSKNCNPKVLSRCLAVRVVGGIVTIYTWLSACNYLGITAKISR